MRRDQAMKKPIRKFVRNEHWGGDLQHALIFGLVVIAAIAAIYTLGIRVFAR
jgi:Flp pilus assembly pilin Flp